ncbi:hypothetical protein D1872_51520 [compost metagenome]
MSDEVRKVINVKRTVPIDRTASREGVDSSGSDHSFHKDVMNPNREQAIKLFERLANDQFKVWWMLTNLEYNFPESKCPMCQTIPICQCGCTRNKAQELLTTIFVPHRFNVD